VDVPGLGNAEVLAITQRACYGSLMQVAIITFLATLLTPSMAIWWQHFSDILISVEAVLGKLIIRALRIQYA